MEPDEKRAFLEEMGIGKSGLDRLSRWAMICWA
jgi:hypothetical protein